MGHYSLYAGPVGWSGMMDRFQLVARPYEIKTDGEVQGY